MTVGNAVGLNEADARQSVALVTGLATVELIDLVEPTPGPGEVTVAIDMCGVCNAEVRAYVTGDGHGPTLCGHEWTGRIHRVGSSVEGLPEGRRVVVAVPDPCGDCASCAANRPEFCSFVMTVARGRDVSPVQPHGGYARWLTVPAYRVLPVPDSVTETSAVMAEPAAVAWHAVRRGDVSPGDRVLVLGAGPIGLLVLACTQIAGAQDVSAVDRNGTRRAAAQRLGAEPALSAIDAEDTGHDVVFECTGDPEMLQHAVNAVRQGGRVVLVGDAATATIAPRLWLAKEVTVISAAGYSRSEIVQVLALMADGRLDPAVLHTRTIALDGLADGLADLADALTEDIKVVLDPRI